MQNSISAHVSKSDKIELEHWTRSNGETYYCLDIGDLNIYFEDVEKVLEIIHAIERPIPRVSKSY